MRISDWSSDVCSSDLIELLPMQVAGAVQGEVDGACGDGGMAVAIDQDETAQGAIARVGFERDWFIEAEIAQPHFVEFQPFGSHRLLGVDVDAMADFGDLRSDAATADLEQIRPPRQQRGRSEEHTSELQSLMRISYAVFCLQ